jgi:hypothetical protein
MDTSAQVGMTLVGDPTLDDCDQFMLAAKNLFLTVGREVGARDLAVLIRSTRPTCGVCEAVPITWVAVERAGKIVRVARCAEHRPETDFPDLLPLEPDEDSA